MQMFSTRESSLATCSVALSEGSILGSVAVSLFELSSLPQPLILRFKVNAGTASLTLAFDALILVLTIRKTWHHVMEMRSLGQTGLMEILLRDGKQTQIFPLPNPPIFNPKLHTGSLYFLSANLIHDH